MGEALGRSKDSIKNRLRQLKLYKLTPQYVNRKGVLRDGYKYILYSDWKTRLDTPCPVLSPCSSCSRLLPIIDFYLKKSGGNKDIRGLSRTNLCPECNTRKYSQKDSRLKLLYGARARALESGRELTITKEDISIPAECPVLGIRLEESTGKGKVYGEEVYNSPSLDRVNNAIGYTPDNICVMSYRANTLKKDGDLDDFLPILAYMIEAETGRLKLDSQFIPYGKRSRKDLIQLLSNYREARPGNRNPKTMGADENAKN